ncbi:MAG: hypothetical protein VXX80_11105, partial [Bacteroidota bacterium]|nr:hypothetical protein [Bacteroidota bacterium]
MRKLTKQQTTNQTNLPNQQQHTKQTMTVNYENKVAEQIKQTQITTKPTNQINRSCSIKWIRRKQHRRRETMNSTQTNKQTKYNVPAKRSQSTKPHTTKTTKTNRITLRRTATDDIVAHQHTQNNKPTHIPITNNHTQTKPNTDTTDQTAATTPMLAVVCVVVVHFQFACMTTSCLVGIWSLVFGWICLYMFVLGWLVQVVLMLFCFFCETVCLVGLVC